MTDKKVHCREHGQSEATYVCQHLVKGSGLGFYFVDDPGNARPDAWCRDCDAMLAKVGEWNDESEVFADIKLLCSGCYDEAKRRNCDRHFKFRCDSCSEIHEGVPGYGWRRPNDYFSIPEAEREKRIEFTDDTCVIDKEFFYVRCNLEISVIDASESLSFGVWISVNKASFDRYLETWNTENLKVHAYIQGPGLRPAIELEPTDHPLAVQQRQGIFMDALKEIYARIAPGKVSAVDPNE